MDKELETDMSSIINEWQKENSPVMPTSWQNMKYGDSITVGKLIAEFRLKSLHIFPYTKCKLRIWEESGSFYGYLNIAIRDHTNSTIDGVAGFGSTAEKAFNGTIRANIELILQYEEKLGRPLTDEDYEYSDPQDF